MPRRALPAASCRSCRTLGTMNAIEITALVTESASRFGDRNPQQFKQLASRIGKAAPQEVAQGLLEVFTAGAVPPSGSPAQELAGLLLVELSPRAEFELAPVLRASLARYELSVEQFPQYLGSLFGASQVLRVLQQLEAEPLSEQERRSLGTLRFWLDGNTAEQSSAPPVAPADRLRRPLI